MTTTPRHLGFCLSEARRIVPTINEVEAELHGADADTIKMHDVALDRLPGRPQVARQDMPRRKAAEP